MKKMLVFYKDRAPRGEKTNWIMHDYRLESNKQLTSNLSTATSTIITINVASKEQWVVCRIFHKSTGLKKVVMPSYVMPMSIGVEHRQGFTDLDTLPPLMGYDMSSSLANPMLLPTASPYQLRDIEAGLSMMGSVVLPMMNDHYIENHHQQMMSDPTPPLSFYQQHQHMMMYMGADQGFMVGAEPGCGPSSMVSQEDAVTGLSNNYQGNATTTAVGTNFCDDVQGSDMLYTISLRHATGGTGVIFILFGRTFLVFLKQTQHERLLADGNASWAGPRAREASACFLFRYFHTFLFSFFAFFLFLFIL